MQEITYHAPRSLPDALTLFREAPGSARYLAGGTDLFLALEHGAERIHTVIDLKRIDGLSGVTTLADGGWRIGALTAMADLVGHPELGRRLPALAEGASVVGGPAVRNRATLGGNLCNASPAADTATPLLALGAGLEVVSADGQRGIPLAGLWEGPRRTRLAPGAVVTAIRVPALPPRSGCAFERLTRSAMDIAVVNASARVSLDPGGRLTGLVVTLGSVAPTVIAVPGLTESLAGRPVDGPLLEAVRQQASAAARPIDDQRASARYRAEMAGELAQRAVRRAAARAAEAAGAGERGP